MVVIFEGSAEEYWQKIAEVVDQRIKASETKKIAPLTYMECYEYLGVTNKTFDKYRKQMGLILVYQSDLERMLRENPKLMKSHLKAKVA